MKPIVKITAILLTTSLCLSAVLDKNGKGDSTLVHLSKARKAMNETIPKPYEQLIDWQRLESDFGVKLTVRK